MSNFIQTDDGYINLDHVAKVIREPIAGSDLWRFSFFNARGEVLAAFDVEREEVVNFPLGPSPLIPAQPGFAAVYVDVETWELRSVPIVAWRVSDEGFVNAVPVDGYLVHGAVEWPDGQLFDGEFVFANRADYVQDRREQVASLTGVNPPVAPHDEKDGGGFA